MTLMAAAPPQPGNSELQEMEEAALRLLGEGRMAEAARTFRTRLQNGPPSLRTVNGYGWAALALNDFPALLQLAELSLGLAPSAAEGWFFKGVASAEMGDLPGSIQCLQRAAAANPRLAAAHYQLGLKFQTAGRIDEALQSLDRALEANPRHSAAHLARAILLGDLSRVDEAIAAVDELVRREPSHRLPAHIKGELLLMRGDYAQGWELIDERAHEGHFDTGAIPLWRGEPLQGMRLLVYPGVGFGDFLMYARFLPALEAQGASLLLKVPEPLAGLLRASFPHARVDTDGTAGADADYHCPVMNLPKVLRAGARSIPAAFPYLQAPAGAREKWRQRLGPAKRMRVGIVWSGRSSRLIDRSILKRRSMPLPAIRPLLDVPVEWHCLQNEILEGDVQAMKALPQLADHSHELADFGETAALAQAMDLVISTDTSVAHLAGALGRPLWVMLPRASDFRWPIQGESPWYPGAWMVRQDAAGDWAGVVAKAAARLRGMQE